MRLQVPSLPLTFPALRRSAIVVAKQLNHTAQFCISREEDATGSDFRASWL